MGDGGASELCNDRSSERAADAPTPLAALFAALPVSSARPAGAAALLAALSASLPDICVRGQPATAGAARDDEMQTSGA